MRSFPQPIQILDCGRSRESSFVVHQQQQYFESTLLSAIPYTSLKISSGITHTTSSTLLRPIPQRMNCHVLALRAYLHISTRVPYPLIQTLYMMSESRIFS